MDRFITSGCLVFANFHLAGSPIFSLGRKPPLSQWTAAIILGCSAFAYCRPMDRCHYFGMLSVCLLSANGPQPLFWDAQCLLILTWQAALQEMRIDLLETRLDNLTQVVQTLADKFDTFAEQVSIPHCLHGTKDGITISSDLGLGSLCSCGKDKVTFSL